MRSSLSLPTIPLPYYHPPVFQTENQGVYYLQEPGLAMIGITYFSLLGVRGFLQGFDQELGFEQYMDDPTPLPSLEAVTKFAGQVCYASFGEKRTYNEDAGRYFANILSSGHGSVLEHAVVTFLVYGISRATSHEWVRHRAGFGYSQLSQRFVSGKVLRFVERMEFMSDPELHEDFKESIEQASLRYEKRAKRLLYLQEQGSSVMTAESLTDMRKKVNQSARACLPNEAETFMVVTANVRAWRHFITSRANPHADTEILRAAFLVYDLLSPMAPKLFQDYKVVELDNGLRAVEPKYPKV